MHIEATSGAKVICPSLVQSDFQLVPYMSRWANDIMHQIECPFEIFREEIVFGEVVILAFLLIKFHFLK